MPAMMVLQKERKLSAKRGQMAMFAERSQLKTLHQKLDYVISLLNSKITEPFPELFNQWTDTVLISDNSAYFNQVILRSRVETDRITLSIRLDNQIVWEHIIQLP